MSMLAPTAPDRPKYYRLAVAARDLYPLPTHPSTLTRHILRGVKLRDGSTRKLTAVRTPHGWFVTAEAVDVFLDAITSDRTGTPPVRRPDPRVEMALDRAGF